jgi:hypothetical protein
MADRYTGSVPTPKGMLKEFDRKRARSSGPTKSGVMRTMPKINKRLPLSFYENMFREGSPTVTDTETGETTYGRPRKFEHGGMASCRGMGKAIKGGKFIGVK